MPSINNIVERHAEEAAFLWSLRQTAVGAPHFTLTNLVELDQRLEANLDGLRIAETSGCEVCKKSLLGNKEAGEVFTAGVLAFEHAQGDRVQEILKEINTGSPQVTRGAVSALGWLRFELAEKVIRQLL